MNRKDLALSGVYAALYVALVTLLPFISFLQLNVRVADGLRGILPLKPRAILLGNLIGQFVANLTSPLGPLDLISVLVATGTLTIAWWISKKSAFVGFLAHAILFGTWLTWLLSYSFHAPFFVLAPFIYIGLAISDVAMPYILFRAMKNRIKW